MITSFKLFEELMSNRKMIDLVLYFRKTIEEKEEDLPRFFDVNYPHVLEDWCAENYNYFLDMEGYDNEEDAIEYHGVIPWDCIKSVYDVEKEKYI